MVKERLASLQDFPQARLPFQWPETNTPSSPVPTEQPAASSTSPEVPIDAATAVEPITGRVTRSQKRLLVGNVSIPDTWHIG